MDKQTPEEIIEKLEAELKQAHDICSVYVRAVNRLDDYFEYSHGSEKDKKVVMKAIDGITDTLCDMHGTPTQKVSNRSGHSVHCDLGDPCSCSQRNK